MRSRPLSTRARNGGRRAASLGLLAALAVAVPTSASAAADVPDATVVIEGTVVQFVGDGKPAAEGEGFSESSSLVMVEVEGQLLSLPEGVDGSALLGGDTVALTVRTQGALSAEESLAEVAAEGTRAQIVGVETVAEGEETDLAAVATGAHQLIVLPVYWSGAAADGTTVAEFQNMADKTAAFWEKQSGGRMDVQQSVADWKPITSPGTTCTDQFLINVYERALAAHGVNGPAPTRHIAVYFPDLVGCGFAGLAQIEGGVIWLNGWPQTYVLAHEYGHNVGLGHANALECTVNGARTPLVAGWTPANTSCVVDEYGDYSDVMGQGEDWWNPGNLSSAFADALGYAHVHPVGSVPVLGQDVGIAPLGSVDAVRAIKVGLGSSTLYADYRPAAFPDDRHRPEWAGVQVHTLAPDSRGVIESFLLDLQPATSPFTKVSLPVGKGWEIPGAGLTLRTVATGGSAVVNVGPGAGTEQVKRYVAKVYKDLFNRAVDPTGLQGWTEALLAGTPRIAVANAITYSDEYRRTLIAGSYQTYLGRGPDQAGADNWLIAMRQGATIQQMEAGFIASSEYYANAGGTDAAWVKKLYQHVLGRAAADAEVQAWTKALAQGGTRYQVAMGFLVSYEHLTDVVNTYYVSLLGRGIDPAGAHSWVIAIQSGVRVEAVIGGIIASDEYYGKV